MSEDKNTPILAPTYQTVLINALNTAVTRMLNNDHVAAFEALRTLHSILKPKMQEFIKEPWEKFLDKKSKIKALEGSIARRAIRYETYIFNFLRKNNPLILQEFIKTLDHFKYLTKDWAPLTSKDFKGMPGEETEEAETK